MSSSLSEYLKKQTKQHKQHTDLLMQADINEGYCPRCLLNYIADLEADLDYLNAILDGSWPNSIGILTKKLKEAKLNNSPESLVTDRG